jgi:hypothetical protein
MMARFTVKVQEVHVVLVEVEADNRQEAQSAAEELIEAGCYPDGKDLPDAVYDHTLGRDEWPAWIE